MKYGKKPNNSTALMPNYKLSKKAELDLLEIAIYGYREFGFVQSEKYRDKLKKQLVVLGDNPLRYPTVEHIRVGYRRSVCGVHSIYYKVSDDGIPKIMRILRGQCTDAI